MPNFTTIPTINQGDPAPPSQWNTYVRDNGNLVGDPPRVHIYHTAAQSIASGVATIIGATSERVDTDTMHDTGTFVERLVAKTAGRYRGAVCIGWAQNGTGSRVVDVIATIGGVGIVLARDARTACADTATFQNVPFDVYLNVNDYVSVTVLQTSGGALNVQPAPGSQEFWMRWEAPS